jgi:hypothetical protein
LAGYQGGSSYSELQFLKEKEKNLVPAGLFKLLEK